MITPSLSLTAPLSSNPDESAPLKPADAHNLWLRSIVTVVALSGITLFVISCHIPLSSLGSIHFSATAITALGALAGCSVIAIGILVKTIKDAKNGSFAGQGHYLKVKISDEHGSALAIIDSSRRVQIEGEAYYPICPQKEFIEHEIICGCVTVITPIKAVGAMAFHALNLVLNPIYRLAKAGYGKLTGTEGYQYTFRDFTHHVAHSLFGIVRAPFYSLAMQYASIYALIDPLNGRKLGSLVEQTWGDGKQLHESIWLPECLASYLTSKFWKDLYLKASSKEGTTLIIPGCWRPFAYIKAPTQEDSQRQEAISFSYYRAKLLEHGNRANIDRVFAT
jgi:hypothetical protein